VPRARNNGGAGAYIVQEFPQNFGALFANPFAFSVLLIVVSGIARYGVIGSEAPLPY
jgi:hypothetical protein